MQTIVFINPPLPRKQRYGILGLTLGELQPIGLCYLSAVTRNNGLRTFILDAAVLNLSIKETVSRALSYNPDFVGISATTPAIYSAATIAQLLKQNKPNLITLIGGRHLTSLPEITMRLFPQFDCGVIGEGEDNIIQLLKLYARRVEPFNVRGIIYRKNCRLILNSIDNPPSDLDSLPMPAYDLLDRYRKYYRPNLSSLNRLPIACIVSSRGCTYRCSFCEIRTAYNHFRYHSAEYLMDTIKYLKKYCGIREIAFKDSNITIPKTRFLRFCELIRKEKLNITWSCMTRADSVSPALLEEMKRSGCWQIGYGVESGSQSLLDFLKKDLSLNTVLNAARWTKEAGIKSIGYFMIGLPKETEKSVKTTLEFIRRCDFDFIKVNFFTPYPGSEIAKSIYKFGSFESNWTKMNEGYPVFIPLGIGIEKLYYYSKKYITSFYLRKKIFIRMIKRINNFKMLLSFLKAFWAILRYGFKKVE